MDTQQLLELYKESLESVLKCLQDKKYSADKFEKLQELQKKIPDSTDCEDTDYKDFVKTSDLVQKQLDTYVRKVDDIGLVLKRIWAIRKNHKNKIKATSITLTPAQETNTFERYVKILIAMETMMESIGEKVDIPVKSPDDATSQAFSQERLEKLGSECDRLEAEVKNLEEMNTGLEDENERYKITYEKKYNKVTEENTAYEQRCKAYENYMSKLDDENKDLNQRLDRLQSPISVQVKELQKRIVENESLIKRLKSQEKYMTETERSEQRVQRPQTAPHSSARQYKELQNQIATLTAEKQSLMQRLSMADSMEMRDNNQDIDELGDPNRPMKIAERFREIYDNEWTNLLDYITDNTDATDDIAIQQIVTATQKIFGQCQCEIIQMKRRVLKSIGYPEDTFEKQYSVGKDGHAPIVKAMKYLVQISTEHISERVLQKIQEIGEIKTILQIGGKSADVFLTKCSKLCSFMCVKDPPMVLDFNFKRGDPFDKDKLSAFTTSGDSVGYLVWPVMYLHENGPVMDKGVAQGRKK